jgi:hypothetical protein
MRVLACDGIHEDGLTLFRDAGWEVKAVDAIKDPGTLSRALADQPADIRDRAAQAVRQAFAARPGETAILIDGAAWIVTATNPG